jgi:hypothetical protein
MPTRSSKRSEPLVLQALILACISACAAAPLKTRDAPPPETSGAVAVDPVPVLPRATDRALSSDGVATLRAPVPREAVAALVRRWFDAFHARDTSGLEPDLDETIVDLRTDYETVKPRSTFVLYELAPRMKSAPFDQVDVDSMYRPQDVEVWAREELGLAGRPARPNAMQADDLLVRIPIAMTRLGSDVLFGDEVKLLLRRDGSKYRIRGYYEIVPK